MRNQTKIRSEITAIHDKGLVKIHDETSRDGLQCVVSEEDMRRTKYSRVDLMPEYIKALSALGIKFVDAGIPITDGPEGVTNSKIVRAAALASKENPIAVMAFARAVKTDIDKTVETLTEAPENGLCLLTSPSLMHAQKFNKDGSDPKDVQKRQVRKFVDMVKHASDQDIDWLHVYLEDATRMTAQEIADVAAQYINAGATNIALPDTMGLMNHRQYRDLMGEAQQKLGGGFKKSVMACPLS